VYGADCALTGSGIAASTTELAPSRGAIILFSSLAWARCGGYASDLCKYYPETTEHRDPRM